MLSNDNVHRSDLYLIFLFILEFVYFSGCSINVRFAVAIILDYKITCFKSLGHGVFGLFGCSCSMNFCVIKRLENGMIKVTQKFIEQTLGHRVFGLFGSCTSWLLNRLYQSFGSAWRDNESEAWYLIFVFKVFFL